MLRAMGQHTTAKSIHVATVIFALVALLRPPMASAEPGPVEEASPVSVPAMNLQEALDYARFHQPELRAARERFLAVAADARIPSAQWAPAVGAAVELVGSTANNSTSTVLPNGVVDLPRVGGTAITRTPNWHPYATTLAALGLTQELFDFGRIAAQTAASEALVAVERDRLQVTQLDTTYVVTQSYFATRAAHAVVDAATQAEQRAKVHRDFAREAVKAGLRPPIELTRATADLTRFTVGRIRAEGNLRIARTVLAAAVGYNEPELDTGSEPPSFPPLLSLAEVEQRAKSFEPEILQALDQQKAQHARTQAISALTRPNLYASASVSARAGGASANNGLVPDGSGFLPSIPNYSLGLVMQWPLLDPVNDATARASRQREFAYSAQVAAAQQRAVAAVDQMYRRTRVAQSALDALAQATEAARSNYAQADARFRAGLGTSLELADAESIRLEAEVQQAVGGFELATARANLTRVMGE